MEDSAFDYKWFALIGLSLLSFTAFVDFTIVSTALPFIQKDLSASVGQLQWVMSMFSLILSMFMIAAGKAGDLFGQKKVFYIGFIFFAIAAFGAGFAPNIYWLILFRGIQGFAGGIIFTLGIALLPQAFPLKQQTTAISIFSAFNGAGLASGPFLGGLIISYLSWRWVFFINIPVIVFGFLLCFFTLKSSPPPNRNIHLDWLGLILLIGGLGLFIFGLSTASIPEFSLQLTVFSILSGLLILILFYLNERKVPEPLLDLEIFKSPPALLAINVSAITGLITAVFMFFDPLYLKVIKQFDAFTLGLILLCVPIVQVIISILFSYLLKYFSLYKLLLFGLLTAFLSAVGHIFFSFSTSLPFILFFLILMGYTWGIANTGTIMVVQQSTTTQKVGGYIGTIFTCWNVSSALFLALASVIFTFQEKASLNSLLANSKIVLSDDLKLKILHAFDQSNLIIPDISQVEMQHISKSLQHAFLSGYHLVAMAASMVMLIAYFIGRLLNNYINK